MCVLLSFLEFYVFYLHILHTCCNLLCMKMMEYEGKCEGRVKDVKEGVVEEPPKKRLHVYRKMQIYSMT